MQHHSVLRVRQDTSTQQSAAPPPGQAGVPLPRGAAGWPPSLDVYLCLSVYMFINRFIEISTYIFIYVSVYFSMYLIPSFFIRGEAKVKIMAYFTAAPCLGAHQLPQSLSRCWERIRNREHPCLSSRLPCRHPCTHQPGEEDEQQVGRAPRRERNRVYGIVTCGANHCTKALPCTTEGWEANEEQKTRE